MNREGEIAAGLPLPTMPYLPGVNERPPEDAFDFPELAPDPDAVTRADRSVAWHYGLRLLANGFYWEAHEVLEPVWMQAEPNSRERFAVQAVIQIANAALKARLEKPRAARRLLVLASALLKRAASGPEIILGIAASSVAQALNELSARGRADHGAIAHAFLQYSAIAADKSAAYHLDEI